MGTRLRMARWGQAGLSSHQGHVVRLTEEGMALRCSEARHHQNSGKAFETQDAGRAAQSTAQAEASHNAEEDVITHVSGTYRQ